ncbi:putative protein of unknown function (DUF4483) [Blattamonas nauphoetae]|uniref:Uncharacterized protein n=1 Tax=Blattamonas nauphoetae TaxID=2049346 RepID=A0ABQ9WVA1_9EUKA|nr:putative protein of unknown function (DUF4483) [Blattamonas nauphoetae]
MNYDDDCEIHLGSNPSHPMLRRTLLARCKVNATKGIKGDETFGRPSKPDEVGVAGCLQYKEFTPKQPKYNTRDFKKANREAAKMGVVTARGDYEFRKDHDYRIKPVKKQKHTGNPGIKDRNYAYGVNTEPDNIMKELMEGRFGNEWLEREVQVDQIRTRKFAPKPIQPSVQVNAMKSKRGGLGLSTKRPLEEAEEALIERDFRQTQISQKMREGIDVKPKVETHWKEPPKRLPRIYKDPETGEMYQEGEEAPSVTRRREAKLQAQQQQEEEGY